MSLRGNPVLNVGKYRYHRQRYSRFKKDGAEEQWLCEKWTKGGCRASVVTQNQMVIRAKNEHNH